MPDKINVHKCNCGADPIIINRGSYIAIYCHDCDDYLHHTGTVEEAIKECNKAVGTWGEVTSQ